ncbi:FAD synthetase family protein [Rhizorhabdus dicambivorans]|nr:FAD synthetase family protein [Rhizorhabdus dicambivorans]
MKIVHHSKIGSSDIGGATLVLGNFDGVHLGHRALIEAAKCHGGPVGAVTFEPHPRQFFEPDQPAFHLCSPEEKLARLVAAGCDFVVVLRFDEARAGQSAVSFLRDTLGRELRARHVVVGKDFSFGKERRGTAPILRRLGPRFGFSAEIVPKLCDGGEQYSSSRARRYLADGRVGRVSAALGRPWQLPARIDRIGAADLSLELLGDERLLPPPGDYLVAISPDGLGWRNASCRLETGDGARRCEARGHVDGYPGMTLDLAFLSRIEPELRRPPVKASSHRADDRGTGLSAMAGG